MDGIDGTIIVWIKGEKCPLRVWENKCFMVHFAHFITDDNRKLRVGGVKPDSLSISTDTFAVFVNEILIYNVIY